MQNILLLGGSGMLGHALAHTFADQHVTAPSSSELDITDGDAVRKFVGELQPDVILNAAAYTAVDKAEEEEQLANAVNAQAVEHLAHAAKEVDALLVHYSTDYVFDGQKSEGYVEDDSPSRPLNIYGATKLAAEIATQNVDCRHAIIRTSWLFGPDGKHFVDTMLRLGAEREHLTIVADQVGCPTYTPDLATATRELVDNMCHPEEGEARLEGGIFHLVNEGPVSWAEFAREIFRQSGTSCEVVDIPSSDYPTPAQRPACSVLHNTRRPKLRRWQEALSEYLSSRA